MSLVTPVKSFWQSGCAYVPHLLLDLELILKLELCLVFLFPILNKSQYKNVKFAYLITQETDSAHRA